MYFRSTCTRGPVFASFQWIDDEAEGLDEMSFLLVAVVSECGNLFLRIAARLHSCVCSNIVWGEAFTTYNSISITPYLLYSAYFFLMALSITPYPLCICFSVSPHWNVSSVGTEPLSPLFTAPPPHQAKRLEQRKRSLSSR